ncbi:MAG: hypothetical protein ACI9R3_005526 [Verrucomicrobiales bacterium]|jgi:hypothetical protein
MWMAILDKAQFNLAIKLPISNVKVEAEASLS